MADEKLMVSTNALNAAMKKQMEKRAAAAVPDDAKVETYLAALVAPAPAVAAADGPLGNFCEMWDAYYPRLVSLLGWASWIFPSKTLTPIKALLAVINNQIIHGSVGLCGPKA